MKNFVASFNGLAIAAAFAMLTATFVSIPVDSAQAWWKCSSGYQLKLKTNNTKARCYKAAVEDIKSTRACPKVRVPGTNVQVGTTKRKNYSGNRDKCVVLQSGFNVPVPCQFGYALQIKSGWDKCRKYTAAKQKNLTVNTN